MLRYTRDVRVYPRGLVAAIVQAAGVTRGRVYQVLDHAPVSARALAVAVRAVESFKSEKLSPQEAVERLIESGPEGHRAWFTYSLATRRRSISKWRISWLGVLMLYSVYYDMKVLEGASGAPMG